MGAAEVLRIAVRERVARGQKVRTTALGCFFNFTGGVKSLSG